jgi:hypothetical protein
MPIAVRGEDGMIMHETSRDRIKTCGTSRERSMLNETGRQRMLLAQTMR